ncbi:MAG: peptidylprolyl isomerase [Akkermansiaceae bacterium]
MKTLLYLTTSFFLLACQSEGDNTTETKKLDPKAAEAANKAGPVVVIETSMGTIEARLHAGTAPITTKNFLKYVGKKHYDGTIFHRVISNFMIQGGGFELKDEVPTEKATEKEIKNESPQSKSNVRGTLAMARRPDPDSASAQFFINVKENTSLDYPNSGGHGYAVFGEVIKGMDVVDKIKEVPTGSSYMNSLLPNGRFRAGPSRDVPVKPVIIKSIRVAEKK